MVIVSSREYQMRTAAKAFPFREYYTAMPNLRVSIPLIPYGRKRSTSPGAPDRAVAGVMR